MLLLNHAVFITSQSFHTQSIWSKVFHIFPSHRSVVKFQKATDADMPRKELHKFTFKWCHSGFWWWSTEGSYRSV